MRGPVALLGVLFALALPAGARAQDRAVLDARGPRLVYHRAPASWGCLDEEAFRERVANWGTGKDRLGGPDAPDVVDVRYERGNGRYRGVVVYTGAGGNSHTEVVYRDGHDCVALAYGVSFVVAERVPWPPKSCPEAQAGQAQAAAQAEACPPCRCPDCPKCRLPHLDRTRDPWQRGRGMLVGISGFVLLTGGLWADPGAAFALAVDLRGKNPETWSITGGFGMELRMSVGTIVADIQDAPNTPWTPYAIETWQVTGAFVPCARFKYLFGCGVAQLGAYVLSDDGNYKSDGQPSFAFGPRVGARLPLGEHVALFALGELLVSPFRAGFSFGPSVGGDPNVYWLPSLVQGYGGVGIEVVFGD